MQLNITDIFYRSRKYNRVTYSIARFIVRNGGCFFWLEEWPHFQPHFHQKKKFNLHPWTISINHQLRGYIHSRFWVEVNFDDGNIHHFDKFLDKFILLFPIWDNIWHSHKFGIKLVFFFHNLILFTLSKIWLFFNHVLQHRPKCPMI